MRFRRLYGIQPRRHAASGLIETHSADICQSVHDGNTTWTEWHWWGTRSDGQTFDMRGVTLFEIVADQIVAGRLFMEDVERDGAGIEHVVRALSGRQPRAN